MTEKTIADNLAIEPNTKIWLSDADLEPLSRLPNRKKALMPNNQIRFDNGAAYERYMGQWSQLVGETFLDWLAPKSGLRWLDVGCGNGAFTKIDLRAVRASLHTRDRPF